MSTAPPPPPADARGRLPRPISVDEFAAMIKVDVLDDHRRVELWDGRLVERPAETCPHTIAWCKTSTPFFRFLPAGWHVEQRCPLMLGPRHLPELDLGLVRGEPDDYPDRYPRGSEVGLVVEILDPGSDVDLGPVIAAYAAGGVPALWLVDLRSGRIEAHADPVGGETPGYRRVRSYGPSETIPLGLDGRVIAELADADLLPER